jgi:hypothetical protein
MGNWHCVPSSCAEVVYQEYLPPVVRWRYPGENWQEIEADDYSLAQIQQPCPGQPHELNYGRQNVLNPRESCTRTDITIFAPRRSWTGNTNAPFSNLRISVPEKNIEQIYSDPLTAPEINLIYCGNFSPRTYVYVTDSLGIERQIVNTAGYSDVCKAIEPIDQIKLQDLYQFCDDSGIDRADYPEGDSGFRDYQDAVKAYLQALLNETKYAPLIDSTTGDILLSAPKYWITNILADFSLIQSKINQKKLCSLNIDEPDVVSIVASPKVVTNVDGKVLILHFVTEANYPKRARGSNYRQIQIPGAKTEYIWELDFANLRWNQGNQYAELVLNEYRATVSGWFANQSAADTFFDAVLALTIGTEKNRKYPKHKFPRTDIQAQITRPYRAFIESINDQGQAVCHVKYVPPIEP